MHGPRLVSETSIFRYNDSTSYVMALLDSHFSPNHQTGKGDLGQGIKLGLEKDDSGRKQTRIVSSGVVMASIDNRAYNGSLKNDDWRIVFKIKRESLC